jgi:predicted lipid-binding transport protein (Tim44 family)
MRVLERRSPLPAADLSAPQTQSYAVSPVRPARAQILVKRAATAEPAAQAPAPARAQPAAKDRLVARRNRAMIMLGALSTVVVTLPLVAFGMLPLITVLVPVASVGIAVAWARTTTAAERQTGRGAASAAHEVRPVRSGERPAAQAARRPAAAQLVPTVQSARTLDVDDVVQEAPAAHLDTAADGDLGQTALYDVQAVEQREQESVRAAQAASRSVRPVRLLVDEDDIPLTWDPVPVPRPTYTLKSRATRPAPAAADLVGDADTEYAAYDEAPVRRVAGA